MNKTLFEQASRLYDAQDYRGALRKYTACLKDNATPFEQGEIGLIYHRIGNCLVKLNNPSEAIKSYKRAASDATYASLGALENNIGTAYASMHDYENAATYFEKATEDASYDTPYKAYLGLGNAQLKLGKNAEAGIAFREAALDEANPDPAKALLNLGVCFMALGRPQDAVASYKSAFDFNMTPEIKNRLYASMGQAYAADDQFQEAVEAFTQATADGTYLLSDSASVDYQRSIEGLARMVDENQLAQIADTSGLDVNTTEGHFFTDEEQDPFFYDEQVDATEAFPGYIDVSGTAEDRFFNATDEELEKWSRGLAKKERKRRNVGLKILIAIIIILVLALAAAAFAYTQGYGWPTQSSVVQEFFADPEGTSAELFSSSLAQDDIDSILDPVVQDANVQIDGVNRSMSESTVYATATTEEGGEITYKVSLARDSIGWKISGVELYFASQN